jgi:hypothetical protein
MYPERADQTRYLFLIGRTDTNYGGSYKKEQKVKKRQKMSSRKSKKYFAAAGKKTHWKNLAARPMRGGIRL